MTNWAHLGHAYGSAHDIPALLDRIARQPSPALWDDLWSALCHQGTVHPASFAALPWLADVARGDDREQAVNALVLAGAIMAGAEQPHGAGDVRARYAADADTLLVAVDRHLRTASGRSDYLHLLQAMLGLEGVAGWGEDLAWGLGNEEYEADCPGCGTGLFVIFGERGFFCTDEDYALTDDARGAGDANNTDESHHTIRTRPLRPADPSRLDGIGRRLHAIALLDARHDVAHALTHLFGHATCPACEIDFPVAARVRAAADRTGG